jgi:hypothetical protein
VLSYIIILTFFWLTKASVRHGLYLNPFYQIPVMYVVLFGQSANNDNSLPDGIAPLPLFVLDGMLSSA